MGSTWPVTFSWHVDAQWSLHNMSGCQPARVNLASGAGHGLFVATLIRAESALDAFCSTKGCRRAFVPSAFTVHCMGLRPCSASASDPSEAASLHEGGMTSESKEADACHSSAWPWPLNLSKTGCSDRCADPSLSRPVLREENLLPFQSLWKKAME